MTGSTATLEGESPIGKTVGEALAVMDDVLKQIGESGASVEAKLEQSVIALDQQILEAEEQFCIFSETYSKRVTSLSARATWITRKPSQGDGRNRKSSYPRTEAGQLQGSW